MRSTLVIRRSIRTGSAVSIALRRLVEQLAHVEVRVGRLGPAGLVAGRVGVDGLGQDEQVGEVEQACA